MRVDGRERVEARPNAPANPGGSSIRMSAIGSSVSAFAPSRARSSSTAFPTAASSLGSRRFDGSFSLYA